MMELFYQAKNYSMKDVSKMVNIIVTDCNVWYPILLCYLVGPKLDNYGMTYQVLSCLIFYTTSLSRVF